MSIVRKYINWLKRCRTCETDGIAGGLLDQFSGLSAIEPLKFGYLYQCSKCNEFWFYHSNKSWLCRIHKEHLPFVHHWNKQILTCDGAVIDVLSSIKGVLNACYEHISIPCSVKHKSGILYKKAVVMVSKHPPYRWPEPQKVFWAEDIVSVSASPYSLSFDIRRFSSTKVEEKMGFAPVGVVSENGKHYTLGCESFFFDHDGITGEHLQLSEQQKKWRNVVWPESPDAYFFVDWYDQCEKQLSPD